MRLIFIYGPPAVGKLTVAKEIAKLTGFKLFHNHLTQDLAGEIYPEFGQQRFDLATSIRLNVFEYTAKNNTDIIFTAVCCNDDDGKKFVSDTLKVVTENNGTVCFVQLSAPREVLLDRVSDESRTKFHKITSKDKLAESLNSHDLESQIATDNLITIDTSKQNAEESAKQIIDYFKLPIV